MKLMSDYACTFPVWSDSGRLDETQIAISSELATDLKNWQEHFEQNFHWDTNWRTAAAEAEYAYAAPGLRERLIRELGPHVEVELDMWPVSDKKLRKWLKARSKDSQS